MAKQERFSVKLGSVSLTHAPFVQIRRGKDEFLQVPERLEATVEGPGYVATVRTGIDDSLSPEIEEITIRRTRGRSMSELVRLPVGRILEEIIELGAFRWVRDSANPDRWVLDTESERVRHAASLAITRGRRPETARIDDEVENVARLWPEACEYDAPIRYIADKLGLTYRTAQRRKEAAVKRGLIT